MQEILVVEDSDTDAELLERALRAAEVMNPVRRFADGHQALAYFIPWKAGPSAGFTGYYKSVSGTLGRGTCSENVLNLIFHAATSQFHLPVSLER